MILKKKNLVFIVTYNASKKILDIFKKINANKKLKKYDIYISDDYSKDDTSEYIKKIKKKNLTIKINKKNLGYGGNIKHCIDYAIKNKYDYAVMIHGDDQYHVKHIPILLKKLNKPKIAAVTGSRMQNKKDALIGKMPLYKFIGNIVLTKTFNFFFSTKFSDAHTGLWSYNLKIIKKIGYNKIDNGYNFDSQLRIKITKNNYFIDEIPIKASYKDEHSNYHFGYSFNFLLDMFLVKIGLKKF